MKRENMEMRNPARSERRWAASVITERACDVSSDEFNGHEGKAETADFYKFCDCGAVLDFKLGLEIAFSEMVVDVFLFERRSDVNVHFCIHFYLLMLYILGLIQSKLL